MGLCHHMDHLPVLSIVSREKDERHPKIWTVLFNQNGQEWTRLLIYLKSLLFFGGPGVKTIK